MGRLNSKAATALYLLAVGMPASALTGPNGLEPVSESKKAEGQLSKKKVGQVESEDCREGRPTARSERCAAWKSADAAAYAAWLSFWQMLIGAGGLLGLLYSLHLNRRATNAAAEANADTAKSVAIAERNANAAADLVRVSQRASEAELRGYLDFKNVKLIFNPKRDSESKSCVGVRIEVQNFGRTPASNVVISFTLSVATLGVTGDTPLYTDTLSPGVIAPSDSCGGNLWIFVSKAESEELQSGAKYMSVTAEVSYSDVFDKKHFLKSSFEGINHDHFSAIEGSRVAT